MSLARQRSAFWLGCSRAGIWVPLAGYGDQTAAVSTRVLPVLTTAVRGCRDGYVRMVITGVPTDEASLTDGGIENVAIITNDSIWEIQSDSVPLNRESVNLQERKIRWKDSRYRYQ